MNNGLVRNVWGDSGWTGMGNRTSKTGTSLLERLFRHFNHSADGFLDRVGPVHQVRAGRLFIIIIVTIFIIALLPGRLLQ